MSTFIAAILASGGARLKYREAIFYISGFRASPSSHKRGEIEITECERGEQNGLDALNPPLAGVKVEIPC
jgi:hypothetical protein